MNSFTFHLQDVHCAVCTCVLTISPAEMRNVYSVVGRFLLTSVISSDDDAGERSHDGEDCLVYRSHTSSDPQLQEVHSPEQSVSLTRVKDQHLSSYSDSGVENVEH